MPTIAQRSLPGCMTFAALTKANDFTRTDKKMRASDCQQAKTRTVMRGDSDRAAMKTSRNMRRSRVVVGTEVPGRRMTAGTYRYSLQVRFLR